MSLLGKVGNFLKKAVKTVAPIAATGVLGPVGAAIGTVITARQSVSTARPSLPISVPQVSAFGTAGLAALPGAGLTTLSRIAPMAGKQIAKYAPEIAAGVAGSYIYDNMGNIIGRRRKYKRINPLNAKAARRAIRRIKAVRKITNDIERQLPHRKVHSAPARCPPRRR